MVRKVQEAAPGEGGRGSWTVEEGVDAFRPVSRGREWGAGNAPRRRLLRHGSQGGHGVGRRRPDLIYYGNIDFFFLGVFFSRS